jgi:hypothetical protein
MMGLYIYVSEQDRESKRQVSDIELNEEFQEALKCEPLLMIEEYQTVKKRWFKKDIVETKYNLYHETPAHNGSAYQARQQFSGSGSKNFVISYLHGIINGYHSSKNKSTTQ